MAKKPNTAPGQTGLFGECAVCPTLATLPLIVEPCDRVEVQAPGSIYQPLLLDRQDGNTVVGPGKLDGNEEAFVKDLIRFLCPDGDYPRSGQTPLRWEGREIWLKRNLDREAGSFRLRVEDSDWFYPDFIVWILDRATRTQTFGFVDPKGLVQGVRGGWSDYKLVSTLYMPHVLEFELAKRGEKVICDGEEWTFRIRGVLVSTASLADLNDEAKFHVHDSGSGVAPSEADFNHGRIVFQTQARNRSYVEKVLNLLLEDGPLDRVLRLAAGMRYGGTQPEDETGFDLALRYANNRDGEARFVGEIIKDYLKPDSNGLIGATARKKRRAELLEYAHGGVFGLGAEKALKIAEHPCPCEELWRRKHGNGA